MNSKLLLVLLTITLTSCQPQPLESKIVGLWVEDKKTHIIDGDTVEYPISIPPISNIEDHKKLNVYLDFRIDGTVHQLSHSKDLIAKSTYKIDKKYLYYGDNNFEVLLLNDTLFAYKENSIIVDYTIIRYKKVPN